MWSVMNSGPVAQFKPIDRRGACMIEAYSASMPWPASIVPVGSIVTEAMIGTLQPTFVNASWTAIRPALRLRVSCIVSSSSTSAPPSSSPSACVR